MLELEIRHGLFILRKEDNQTIIDIVKSNGDIKFRIIMEDKISDTPSKPFSDAYLSDTEIIDVARFEEISILSTKTLVDDIITIGHKDETSKLNLN